MASFLEESAFLVSWPAADAVRHSNPLALYVMFESEVAAAYPAIHAAGGDQFLVQVVCLGNIDYGKDSTTGAKTK